MVCTENERRGHPRPLGDQDDDDVGRDGCSKVDLRSSRRIIDGQYAIARKLIGDHRGPRCASGGGAASSGEAIDAQTRSTASCPARRRVPRTGCRLPSRETLRAPVTPGSAPAAREAMREVRFGNRTKLGTFMSGPIGGASASTSARPRGGGDIVNVTPDARSRGGVRIHGAGPSPAASRCSGQHPLDIGGESSRPERATGSASGSVARVRPVLTRRRSSSAAGRSRSTVVESLRAAAQARRRHRPTTSRRCARRARSAPIRRRIAARRLPDACAAHAVDLTRRPTTTSPPKCGDSRRSGDQTARQQRESAAKRIVGPGIGFRQRRRRKTSAAPRARTCSSRSAPPLLVSWSPAQVGAGPLPGCSPAKAPAEPVASFRRARLRRPASSRAPSSPCSARRAHRRVRRCRDGRGSGAAGRPRRRSPASSARASLMSRTRHRRHPRHGRRGADHAGACMPAFGHRRPPGPAQRRNAADRR